MALFEPKLGVSLHTISDTLTQELYEAIGGSAIATVEITARFFNGEGDEAQKGGLTRALRETGIEPASIHAHFGGQYDWSVLDEDAQRRALNVGLSAIELAGELGAPLVVVHASAEPIGDGERAERMARARQALEALSTRGRGTGVRLAVELLPRTCLGNTVGELGEILDGLDEETLGVCMDMNHLMERYESLPDEIRRLGDRLIATHLSDYDGVDEKHQLPGEGVVDWAGVMAALGDIDYRGPLNYECKLGEGTPEDRVAAVEANFQWLRSL